jgi:hypothetical protein
MASCLRQVLQDHLHTSEYWGVPVNWILDAISLVRDAIAYSEKTGSPLFALSLDFQNASERITHHYLFHILQRQGISNWFIERLQALNENATASVQFNGTLAGPITILSAVRQGCPLIMVLYALCLHPLLRTLEETLPGIQLGRHWRSVPVIAYADDVTVLKTLSFATRYIFMKKSMEPCSIPRNRKPLQ